MTKKRKAGLFVDRSQRLNNATRLPNVFNTAKAMPCNNHFYSLEARFKHKIVVDSADDFLNGYILPNGICVLMSAVAVDAAGVVFSEDLSVDNISGKLKKGAKVMQAGDVLCSVVVPAVERVSSVSTVLNSAATSSTTTTTTADGNKTNSSTRLLRTPIGGQLLELNQALITQPELLRQQHLGAGYIAVIFPDTEIPSLDGSRDYDALVTDIDKRKQQRTANLCHAFINGKCNRGDSCKFRHACTDS